MLLAVGCQESGGAAAESAEATGSARTAASSSPAVEKTREQVMSDFRFAAVGLGEQLTITPLAECTISALALSLDPMGKEEVVHIVRRLEKRGWQLEGEVSPEGGTLLSVGKWDTFVGAGPLPDELRAQASPNTSGLTLSTTGACASRPPVPSTEAPLPPTLPTTP